MFIVAYGCLKWQVFVTPRLLKALRKILVESALVEIHEESAVVSLCSKGSRVTGVKTIHGENIEGDVVLICSGAWTPKVSGQDS